MSATNTQRNQIRGLLLLVFLSLLENSHLGTHCSSVVRISVRIQATLLVFVLLQFVNRLYYPGIVWTFCPRTHVFEPTLCNPLIASKYSYLFLSYTCVYTFSESFTRTPLFVLVYSYSCPRTHVVVPFRIQLVVIIDFNS